MTASATFLGRPAVRPGRPSLTGFRNFAAKDAREWFRTRRAIVTTVAATWILGFGVASQKIVEKVDPGNALDLPRDPSSIMGQQAGFNELIPLFAVLVAMGLLVNERSHGTLAWSLSLPLARPAVLLSKLVTTLVAVAIFIVVIPVTVCFLLTNALYGGWPNVEATIWVPLGAYMVASFFVVFALAASTFVKGQMAVAGATFAFSLLIPELVASMLPRLTDWLPTAVDDWLLDVTAGRHPEPTNFIAWAVSIAVLLGLAFVRFQREEP